MRDIIVLTGRAGAGKTTVANYLVSELGYARVRFAGPLKAMAKALGLNDDEIDGHLKEQPCSKLTWENAAELVLNVDAAFTAIGAELVDGEPIELLGDHTATYCAATFAYTVLACIAKGGAQGATPRSLMQMIGTEWGRQMIREDLWLVLWRAEIEKLHSSQPVVIDDCRFPNEWFECGEMGRRLVFKITRTTGAALGETEKAHESEAYQLPFDFWVENNSTPADVGGTVRTLVWQSKLGQAVDPVNELSDS